MNYDWNWLVFLQATIDGGSRYAWWMLSGFGLTVLIALAAWVLALALGVGLGVARTLPSVALRVPVVLYVEVFRNIPLLVQLFFWYYIAPVLLGERARPLFAGLGIDAMAQRAQLQVVDSRSIGTDHRLLLQPAPR